MKNLSLLALFFITTNAFAQVGVGTTSPNSTLDVRGSLSTNYRAFTANTSAGTDNNLVFTGTSATTLTLPDATTMTGRAYWIKNNSSNASTLTIATTSSQTIDGVTTWALSERYKALKVVSNGTNWDIATESLPGSSAGSAWVYGGNNVPSLQRIGTTSNYDFPIYTNNTEKMRVSATGNVGIGTTSFNGSNPEKLLVDAGSTSSYNVISGKGTINNYLQLNIQNNSSGSNASADVVATANNGNETVNYVDMGINSSTYSNGSFTITAANDAYLYTTGNDFAIGNATNNKVLKFFTGGTLAANERMRVSHDGNVAIGATSFDGSNPEKLLVNAGTTSSSNLIRGTGSMNAVLLNSIRNTSTGTNAGADTRVFNDNNNYLTMGINATTYSGSAIYSGAGDALLYSNANDFVIGNTVSNKNLRFFTGGTATTNERMRINSSGNVGIGATSFNGTAPEKLLVDAGTTTSYNVISGKGSINSYLQLNIQNNSSGTGASSDVVATANNGSESSNFVNMGINGGGNTSSGVLGGANTAYLYSTGNDFSIGNGTNDAELKFFTTTSSTNTERMRIEGTTGNVAIGTTSFNGTAPEKLLVDAGTTSSYNVISGKGSINSYLQLNIQNNSSGTGASSDVVATANNGSESANFVNMGINGGGNTSTGVIGGANTAYLYATGNDFAIGNATSAKDLVFFTGGTGASNERVRVTSSAIQPGSDNAISNGTSSRRWSVVYAANGTIQTSDLRLKKNISPLNYGLKEVLQMQPVSYDWKDNSGHKIGLIAQQVRKVVPEVVLGDETKENLGMNYAELVPVLINSVKELKTEITELQKQIAELKKQTKK